MPMVQRELFNNWFKSNATPFPSSNTVDPGFPHPKMDMKKDYILKREWGERDMYLGNLFGKTYNSIDWLSFCPLKAESFQTITSLFASSSILNYLISHAIIPFTMLKRD